MPTITLPGLASGLDIAGMVKGLTDAQRVPYETRMAKQQGEITTTISAMGSLKGALESVEKALEKLNDSKLYSERSASGRDDFIGISVDETAGVGSYDIKVDKLAESHKLLSGSFASDDKVGEGTLEFTSGSDNFTLDITADHTLSDIKDLINDHPDNSNVVATIISDENGDRLVLNSKKTGEDNAIQVTATPADPLDPANRLGEFHYDPNDLPGSTLTELNAAQDAQITIDGTVTVTSSTNEFVNPIEGITLTAKEVHDVDDNDSRIGVSENTSAAKTAIEEFVTAYNGLVDLSSQLGKAGGSGEESGALVGDSMLRGVMTKLRKTLSESNGSQELGQLNMTELGLSTDRYGKISFDSGDFDKLAAENPRGIEQFFVGTDKNPGFAGKLDSLLENYTSSDGMIQARLDGFDDQLARMDADFIAFGERMDAYSARITKQFNAMDAMLAGMNSTSAYLEQQFKNLPGVVKKSS